MACFSRGCSQGEFNGYYYATIIWPRSRQVQLNYCTFDTKTLIEYFKEISRLLGFTLISLVKSTHSYKLQIRCAPDNRFFVYSAMYIRYVYENPFGYYYTLHGKIEQTFQNWILLKLCNFILHCFMMEKMSLPRIR